MPKYPDIFFTEEYSQLFKDTAFGGESCHFNFAGIDYRFYKRPIPGTPYFDIVSPYGYSGMVDTESIACAWEWESHRIAFEHYCKANNIIAEFARLHPFIENHKRLEPDCLKYEHDIFYIDLTQREDDIWKGFDKGCKSAIKKAQKSLKVDCREAARFEWPILYEITMKRKQAQAQYIFDYNFWGKTETQEYIKVFGVFNPVFMLAGCMLLTHDDYCHYFLSASEDNSIGATNLLLWEAIKWAKAQGCKIFNLGGGLKAGDSLESFKRSFTKTSKPFFTYRKIHDQAVYNQLCQAKGVQPNSESWFPAYRRT